MIVKSITRLSLLFYPKKKYDQIKKDVISHISLGKKFWQKDENIYIIDGKSIHVRFAKNPWFSITPPDLNCDFTLWIINSKDCYYLIPNIVINDINENGTYVDELYGYKDVNIDINTDKCMYAPRSRIDFSKYRNTFLISLLN